MDDFEKLDEDRIKVFNSITNRTQGAVTPFCKIWMTSNPEPFHTDIKIGTIESIYPIQMRLYKSLINYPGRIAYESSGMRAKDFINHRMYCSQSKSKRRHAISPLNKRILETAKRSHRYKYIKLEDLKGLSRVLRIVLLGMIRMNPRYGVMGLDYNDEGDSNNEKVD